MKEKKERARKAETVEDTWQLYARLLSQSISLNLHIAPELDFINSPREDFFTWEWEKIGTFPKVILLLKLEIKFSFDSKSHGHPTTHLFFHMRRKDIKNHSLCLYYIWGQEAFSERTAGADTHHVILFKNKKKQLFISICLSPTGDILTF